MGSPGTWTPLRYVLISGMPLPAAAAEPHATTEPLTLEYATQKAQKTR